VGAGRASGRAAIAVPLGRGTLARLQQQAPETLITIILPEFLPARWWQQLLHNQTALLIKGALLFRRGVIVTDAPYHLVAKARPDAAADA